MKTRSLLVLLLAALCAGLFPSTARAQLEVDLKLERVNFVTLEPIRATVTVTNKVGKDVVLGKTDGRSWLDFEVTDTKGRLVDSLREMRMANIVLRNGESVQREFNLGTHFYLSDNGPYLVRANAWFPDLERNCSSRRVRFTVNPMGSPRWQDTFAVPAGYKDTGSYRRFQLNTYHDIEKTYLYLTLKDEANDLILARYPLSSIVVDRDIEPAVDAQKNLHVLYLGSPSVYVYQKVSPEGVVLQQQFYKFGKGVPQLIAAPSGDVTVSGGTVYDPTVKPPAEENFRRLSDAPPIPLPR